MYRYIINIYIHTARAHTHTCTRRAVSHIYIHVLTYICMREHAPIPSVTGQRYNHDLLQ